MTHRFFKKGVLTVSLIVSLISLIFVLAACGGEEATTGGGGGGGEPPALPSAEELTADVRNAFQNLEDYHATLDITFGGPIPGKVTMDVFMRGAISGFASGNMPDVRGEILQSDLSQLPQGAIAVFAQTSYFYDPTDNVVLKAEQNAQGSGGSQLYRIPMMFFGIMTQSYDKLTSPQFTQTVLGTEQVGSYNTYKVSCVAPDGMEDTIWIDQETYLPVQVELDLGVGKQHATITSMEVNPGLDDSHFAFTAPEGAREVVLGEMETVGTLDEASNKAGFAAPAPGYLPADLGPDPVQIQVQNTPLGSNIMQMYGTASLEGDPSAEATVPRQVTIETLKPTKDLPVDEMPSSMAGDTEATKVDIRGQSGTMMQTGEGEEAFVILSWLENGVFYVVSGSGYPAEEVTKIAEGLEIK